MIEVIDILKYYLTIDEYIGFLKGNVLKYVLRANHKGNHLEDLEKAQWYLNRLIKETKAYEYKTTNHE